MVLAGEQIPYDTLATDLFSEDPAQKIVPFLGAGVSISARPEAGSGGAPRPQDRRIAKALDCLRETGEGEAALDSQTLLYAETALEMAFVVQELRSQPRAATAAIRKRLIDEVYPPSAGELVELLMLMAPFAAFDDVLNRISTKLGRRVDSATRDAMLALLKVIAGVVGANPAPLSSISAYFEILRTRQQLLKDLSDILGPKKLPTPTHRLVARAAAWHLKPRKRPDGTAVADGIGDYLIITTNYDCLMETALEEVEVPYVVVSMSMKDFKVRARFGGMKSWRRAAFERANPARPANAFTLARPTLAEAHQRMVNAAAKMRLAIVYKIHGCIQEWAKYDTIVISDNDYVTNISRFWHNDGVVPVCVSEILKGQEQSRQVPPYFLFLGYSLSDWNIRGMLRTIRAKRAGEGNDDLDFGDFTVVRKYNQLDETFCFRSGIRIIHEDLQVFTPRLEQERGA